MEIYLWRLVFLILNKIYICTNNIIESNNKVSPYCWNQERMFKLKILTIVLNRSKKINSPLGPSAKLSLCTAGICSTLTKEIVSWECRCYSSFYYKYKKRKIAWSHILEIQKHFIPSHFNKKSYNCKYETFQSSIKLSQTQIF